MPCSFCNREERNYTPDNHIEKFICSSCTLTFVGANQESLKRGHAKAIDKGYADKAWALKCFIIREEYEQRNSRRKTRRITKRSHGKRSNRNTRPVKKSTFRFKNKRATAVSEN